LLKGKKSEGGGGVAPGDTRRFGVEGGKGEESGAREEGWGIFGIARIAKHLGAGGDEAGAPGIWTEGWGMFGIAWCCLDFMGWG
jgi:hypothetical protein